MNRMQSQSQETPAVEPGEIEAAIAEREKPVKDAQDFADVVMERCKGAALAAACAALC